MTDDRTFLKRLGVTAAFIVAVALVIKLADVLLLAFGAVLVAILLHAIAEPLRRRTLLGPRASLLAAIAIVTVVTGLSLWAFGRQMEAQLASLTDLVPKAWADLKALLGRNPLGRLALPELDHVPGPQGGWLSLAPRFVSSAAAAIASVVIVVFAGLYLAFHPDTYARGLLRLLPLGARERAFEVMGVIDLSLRRFLLGQVFSMVLVGVTTGIGLWLVGVPSPWGLAVIAGLGQFVPVVGPIAATVPGLLVALGSGTHTFLLAGGVYLAASQVEANLITPLVLRKMAELPMAVTLFAVLAMGVLLGPLGVLFATPLAVVAYVLVREVWLRDVLKEPQEGVSPSGPPAGSSPGGSSGRGRKAPGG